MAQARQVSFQLGPQNLEQAWALADALAKSELVPTEYRNKPANVIAMLFMAQDLGVGITHAMREIYVVKGKPSTSSALKVALILQSGVCEAWDILESTDDRCTIRTRRRGKKDASMTLTMEEVRRAGFASEGGDLKDTWKKFPRIMLRHRAESWLGDQEYPDIVRGLKTTEEMVETVDAEPRERVVVPSTSAVVGDAGQAPAQTLPPLAPPPHDPVTGELIDTQPTAPTAAAAPGTPEAIATIEELLIAISKAADEAALERLSPRCGELAPKDHARRGEVTRAYSAKKAELKARK